MTVKFDLYADCSAASITIPTPQTFVNISYDTGLPYSADFIGLAIRED